MRDDDSAGKSEKSVVIHAPRRRVRKTKSERRREIAEAALRLVGKHGISGMTVSRIASAVGLSKGALYQHFPSREAMLWAALDLLSDRGRAHILESSGATALERLETAGIGHGLWSATEIETFVRPIYHIMAGAKQARLQEYLSYGLKRTYDLVLSVVEEGQLEGSIRTDVEARDVAWAILMSHWAEDVALLQGAQADVIASGVSSRNLHRLLATFAAPPTSSTG